MDAFGAIGPEKGDYAEDSRAVAKLLRSYGAVYVELADKSTKLRIVLTGREHLVCPGAEPSGVPLREPNHDDSEEVPANYLHVAVLDHGAYWFRLGDFHQPGYVAARLGIEEPDGETVGEFLTRLNAERSAV